MARYRKLEQIEDPKTIAKIEEMAAKGLTNKQIAKNLGMPIATFYEWKRKSRIMSDALKKSKEIADDEVVSALYKRATGFKVTEDEYEIVDMSQEEYDEHVSILLDAWKQENPEWTAAQRDKYVASIPREKRLHVKTKVKDVAPDTIAAIFWLKNRRPEEWRDKRNLEMSGDVSTNRTIDFSQVSTEDLKKYAETLAETIKGSEDHDVN